MNRSKSDAVKVESTLRTDCARIPILVGLEIDNVRNLQQINQHHAVGDVSDALVLLAREREIDQRPEENAGPTVHEQFHIETATKQTRIDCGGKIHKASQQQQYAIE